MCSVKLEIQDHNYSKLKKNLET